MNKILQKLFESNVLSDETKQLIESQFQESLDIMLSEEREKIENEVRIEMVEQLTKDRNTLIEALDMKLSTIVDAEYAELREDISSFRDLEVEYAERLIEEREALKEEAKASIEELIEKLDSFLELRLNEEFEELRDELQEAKRTNLGKKVFEAFKQEFASIMTEDENSLEHELAITRDQLEEAKSQLLEVRKTAIKEERKTKISELLSNLDGLAKDKMSIILKDVPVTKLSETYERYLPYILRESNVEADPTKIVESKTTKTAPSRVVTGNEEADTADLQVALARLRKLSGNWFFCINKNIYYFLIYRSDYELS